jgi:superfamily II DNA or RNA helicase
VSTPFHSRYFAYELVRRDHRRAGVEPLAMSLFDACVDLNPHQIEAALFALRSPISKGVLLADEVGLGKTIEAGLVLCQYWAERRRRLLVVVPASIQKQWTTELEQKFSLPTVILDSRSYRDAERNGNPNPFEAQAVVVCSMHFASRMSAVLRAVQWDLVVLDEAHKLRNAYRPSNRMGQAIKWALEDRRKILLTATPLQNSLLELYGLSTVIDDRIFGDVSGFRAQYTAGEPDLADLQGRLRPFCKRTLRQQVVEYVQYTERRPITCPFRPDDDEQRFYEAISEFLLRDDTYCIPARQRHLTLLVIRKLLASSSRAIAGTLEALRDRLVVLQEDREPAADLVEEIIGDEELETDLLDEGLDELGEPADGEEGPPDIDRERLHDEIAGLDRFIAWARSIQTDAKARALISALQIGFGEMERTGAARKALIFTESRRTQSFLKDFLEANGYAGQVVVFNGTNSGPDARAVYEGWLQRNLDTGRATGLRAIDTRTALIDHFRDDACIMIATEAGAEGVNLQFCSLVVNYDLPWNPQRIEQRIGRCHRYGQKHDVVVINFLNERNDADRRVLELLEEKFSLFSGLFGASDEVLGTIESEVDFEKRILSIYQECRSPEEIATAFHALREELDASITARMRETRQLLLEFFDEDVHARLRMQLEDARQQLDRFGHMFWSLTRFVLDDQARFDDEALSFDLRTSPLPGVRAGRYHLISKDRENVVGEFLYRLSHPLGEYVVDTGQHLETPLANVIFDVSHHPTRLSAVEKLRGRRGWLTLQRLLVHSFEDEEGLLFSAIDDRGDPLDQETCERLFRCEGRVSDAPPFPADLSQLLTQNAEQHVRAALNRSMETNNRFFREERDRLERWAEDMVVAAEKELSDTKAQIKALQRQARQAETAQEELEIQERIRDLQKKQRRQRQRIFDLEDEIIEKRDELIAGLERRMQQRSSVEPLFTIAWEVH